MKNSNVPLLYMPLSGAEKENGISIFGFMERSAKGVYLSRKGQRQLVEQVRLEQKSTSFRHKKNLLFRTFKTICHL